MANRRALITGATGQDASYLAELLLMLGFEVDGLARRASTNNLSRVAHLLSHPHFKIVRGDVTDAGFIANLVRVGGYHHVYNLAAQSFVGTSYDEPAHTTQVNLNGCLNLLEAIRMLPVAERPRFYQASTSEMFGTSYSLYREYDKFDVLEHFDYLELTPEQALAGCNPRDSQREKLEAVKSWRRWSLREINAFQNENTPFRPTSPYAVAKLAAHHMVGLYRQAYGLHACSGILFNHESARRGEEFVTRKITKYIGKLSREGFGKTGKLKLGNVKACRDWGHAKDYVRGQFLMLEHDTPDDFVLATGVTHSVEDFLGIAFGYAGLDWKEFVEISQSEMRPSEVPYLRGDTSKAKEVLGWEPTTTFRELVEEMVEADMSDSPV